MTEIIMKQKGITLVCLQCGFQARILAGEVPIGGCKFCFKEFGYCMYPDWFKPPRFQYDVPLWDEYNDEIMIVIDGKVPVTSKDRIVQIRRNGMIWYDKATMWEVR